MNPPEFTQQVERLKASFGAKAYPDERVKIIWREVRDLPIHWLTHQVDHWIGALKNAPLMTEIGQAISIERERLWNIEKRNRENDSKDFWNGTYQPHEAAFNFQVIKDRLKRKISDEEWGEFISVLEKRGGVIRV